MNFWNAQKEYQEVMHITGMTLIETIKAVKDSKMTVIHFKMFWLCVGRNPVQAELDVIKHFSIYVFIEFWNRGWRLPEQK